VTGARTPADAWSELAAGNARFVGGVRSHPNQDVDHRATLAAAQRPFALVFGCADSRVAAEIIFDRGRGDPFVVRTAGHVMDPSVLGSLEFGVGLLDIPLIVVLGHDSCGAIAATMDALETGHVPGGYIRDIVERVTPSVLSAQRAGRRHPDEVCADHVVGTAQLLTERSLLIAERLRAGRLGIVGATYDLVDGHAKVVTSFGLEVG